jgi:ABC-type glycerol-3-phosphate transport system substrate-binding protein
MQKKAFVLILVLLLTLGLSAVSAQDDLSSVDPTGQTVVYWNEWTGAQTEAINAIIASFIETNEYGITVESVEYGNSGDMLEAVSAGITSGELPNLVGGFINNAQSWYLDAVAVPLDPYISDPTWGFTEEEMADINFEVIDSFNRIPGEPFNDQLLAWPIGLSSNVLSVNTDLLATLGFENAPATLEEFGEVACAAAEYTGPNGEDVQGFPLRTDPYDMASFIVAQGGDVWNEETQQFDFTNETAIQVLTFFQELYNNGCLYIPETPFANTADFAASLNPFALGSSVGAPFIQRDAEAAGDAGVQNWTFTTVPFSEGNQTVQLFFRSVVMLASTPEQQLATWLFIKHLASTESQILWTENTLYQPYTQSGLEGLSEEFLTANPQFSAVREILLNENVAQYRAPQVLGSREGFAELTNLIVDVTTGGMDVATAAAARQEAANEILAESGAM